MQPDSSASYGGSSPVDYDVTAVVPTRFRAAMARQAIDSVLAQEGVRVRVLVVVDGPDPETISALEDLPRERVEVVAKPANEGVSAARNTGLAAARTPWVALLDDDDLWAPSKLAEQLDLLQTTGAGWCVANVVTFDALTNAPITVIEMPPGAEILTALLTRNVLSGASSSVIASRALLDSVGTFDTSLSFAEDWDFFIRLAQLESPCVARRPLVACRVWRGSVSFDTSAMETGTKLVMNRYATVRSTSRVASDHGAIERYYARQDARSGRRAPAVRRFLRAFVHDRTPKDLVRAAAAAISPTLLVSRMNDSGRASLTEETRRLFDAWYQPLLNPPGHNAGQRES